MLVLSTERDEDIVFVFPNGHIATVTTVDIRGEKVRTGFDFPDDVRIYRRKVYDAINRENRRAAAPVVGSVGPRVVKHGVDLTGGGQ